MKIRFTKPGMPKSGAAVAGVWEEGEMTPAAKRLDEATGGAIARALAAAPRFKGKKGELLPLIAPPNLAVTRIVLAGLGKAEAADARLYRDLGGSLAAHLNSAGRERSLGHDRSRRRPDRRVRSSGRAGAGRAPAQLSLRQIQDQEEAGAKALPRAPHDHDRRAGGRRARLSAARQDRRRGVLHARPRIRAAQRDLSGEFWRHKRRRCASSASRSKCSTKTGCASSA